MDYIDLIELGFQRNDCLSNDTVFFNKCGYNHFTLDYFLFKNDGVEIIIEYVPYNIKYEMVVYKNSNVINRREVSEQEAVSLIEIFKRSGNLDYLNP